MSFSRQFFPVVGLGLLCAFPVRAADMVTAVSPDVTEMQAGDWKVAISPYFWAAGLSGDIAQFGLPTISVDTSFSDILSNLDFAAMVIGEARYDRYTLFADVLYTKLSAGSATPRGILADSVDVTSETFAGLLGGGYSILQDGNSSLDVVAGMRVWSVSTEVSLSGGILNGYDARDSATWVDGLAGVRGRYFFNDSLYLTGWGLIGAGGADLDWDVAGALGYAFNDTFSGIIGYRALGVNYNNDGFIFDVVQQGPIMGLVIRF